MKYSGSNAGAPGEPDLPPYQVVLAETDWASFDTAFGRGEDLPAILARLLEPDPRVQVPALSELGDRVNHQSTVYEATAPVAMYVAGILTHPAAITPRPYRSVPMRATLLSWLASTAHDSSDEVVSRLHQWFPGCLTPTAMESFREIRPMLYRAVSPFTQDTHEDVREAAVVAALILAEHPALAVHRDHLATHARRVLDTSEDNLNRHIAWKALGAWGHDIPDPDPLPEEESWSWGPHGDGRGDREPPF